MPTHTNPFTHQRSATRTAEAIAFGVFRIATYAVIACALSIFALIFLRGSSTLFTSKAPFVNWEFLTRAPETLYVFDFEGRKMELGNAAFRTFTKEHALASIP